MNREKAFVDIWDLIIIPSINSTFDEMDPQFIAQTNADLCDLVFLFNDCLAVCFFETI